MKRLAILFFCFISAGWVSAQESPGPSPLDQARSDADTAQRRESDLSAQIASQERSNAAVREQIRKTGVDPLSLQRDLVDASAEAAAARRKVAAEKLRYDVASDKLATERQRAMGHLEESDAMQAAEREFEDASAAMDRQSQPIFNKLSENPDYQEAQALADAAAQTGEALQGFDAVNPRAQADADAAYDQAMASVHAMEDAAIDADPQAALTHSALKLAQDKIDGLRAENEKQIAADPRVDAARFAFDLEQRQLNENNAELAAAEKNLAALRQAVDPNGGATAELFKELTDGEGRLHDLSTQLEKARIARRDADERLGYLEESAAAARPDDAPLWPLPISPAPAYGGFAEGYVSPYPALPYYTYDPYYCPPCYWPYWSSGLCYGTIYYSHSNFCRPYGYDRYCSANYYHHYHDSSWRNSYAHWRGQDGFATARSGYGRYGSGLASSSSRFNALNPSSPLGWPDLTRDSRLMTDYARHSSISTRDYHSGTRVSTYGYTGSAGGHEREAVSSRSRGYSQDAGERGTISITRSGGSPAAAEERRGSNDSDARHAGFSESGRSSRVEVIRDRSESASRGDRSESSDIVRSDDSSARSRGGDGSRARAGGGDSPDRSSSAGDSARTRGAAGSSLGPSGGVSRSRGSSGPSPDAGAGVSRSRGSAGASPGSSAGVSRSGPPSSGGGAGGGGGGGGRGRH